MMKKETGGRDTAEARRRKIREAFATLFLLTLVFLQGQSALAAKTLKLNEKKIVLYLEEKGRTRFRLVVASKKNLTGADFTWTSSNPKVATVSKKGLVRARKKGKCVITVTRGKRSAVCTVRVRTRMKSITTLKWKSSWPYASYSKIHK